MNSFSQFMELYRSKFGGKPSLRSAFDAGQLVGGLKVERELGAQIKELQELYRELQERNTGEQP